jgi:hypothetical protein
VQELIAKQQAVLSELTVQSQTPTKRQAC